MRGMLGSFGPLHELFQGHWATNCIYTGSFGDGPQRHLRRSNCMRTYGGRCIKKASACRGGQRQQSSNRGGHEETVEPIEQTAMARDQTARILYTEPPLESAFRKITTLRHYAQ